MISRVIFFAALLLACFIASSPLWSKGASSWKASPLLDAARTGVASTDVRVTPASDVSPADEPGEPTTTVTETITETATDTTTATETTTLTETATVTSTAIDTSTATATATVTSTATDTSTVTDTTTSTETATNTVTSTATETSTATDTATTTQTVTATDTAVPTSTASTTSTTSSQAGSGSAEGAQTGPAASFTWLPSHPHVGQSVSLLSTSTPGSSALSGYAWQVDGSPFNAGPVAISLTFATPGDHAVSLRVTDGDGRSSVASQTIPVSSREVTLMQPFPVVHVAGSFSHAGATLRMLSVQAPAGATVLVKCAGAGCPAHRQRMLVRGSTSGETTVQLQRFERLLPAGLRLRIEVFEEGEIGKLTQLRIRRGRPPARSDTCLDAPDLHAVSCPT
jgi:hypothetical protein